MRIVRDWLLPLVLMIITAIFLLIAIGTDSIHQTNYYIDEQPAANMDSEERSLAISRGGKIIFYEVFFQKFHIKGKGYDLFLIMILPAALVFFSIRCWIASGDLTRSRQGRMIVVLCVLLFIGDLVARSVSAPKIYNSSVVDAQERGLIDGLRRSASEINKKAPYVVDELTILLRQEVRGLTITTYFKVNVMKSQVTQELMSQTKTEIISERCKLASIHLGYEGGVVSVYDYVDANNMPLMRFSIDEQVCASILG
ncbi:MAG: hypothetical protein RIC36_03130 [Rhodospirillales bacterium]